MAKVLDPRLTIDMKELALSSNPADKKRCGAILKDYYPKLRKAFPDRAETESRGTYARYLKNANFPWHMLVLRAEDGSIIGGIQYQVVTVNGVWLRKAIWAEHIWLADPEGRSFNNFRALMRIAQERFMASGAQIVFFEFNDRAKMSFRQMMEDAKGGLPTEAREVIWGRVCDRAMHLAIGMNGQPAPYIQPGMDGEAEVRYLSLAFASLTDKPLNRILLSDYLALVQAAHKTIPSVNLDTDRAVVEYRDELVRRIEAGELYFNFVRLADTAVTRLSNTRFVKPRSAFEVVIGGLSELSAEERAVVQRVLTSLPTQPMPDMRLAA